MIIIMVQLATLSPNLSFMRLKPVVLSDRGANNGWKNGGRKAGHMPSDSSETASQMRLWSNLHRWQILSFPCLVK